MSKYLVETVDSYRVDTIGEVEVFQKELRENSNFVLDSFSYAQKTVKHKGEIVDEYFLVKVKKIFNNAKEPMSTVGIEYTGGDF